MIGCLLYVIGDFLFAATGKSQSTESIGLMVKVAYLDMATWRMVVSIICGVLGTALYYIGFHQMWKLLKQRLTQPKQQKWVKLFQIAYLTGTVCWGYVHAMFMNVALIFKFTFEKYGDMQAAAEIANKVFYCNAAPLLPAHKISVQQHHGLSLYIAESFDFHTNLPPRYYLTFMQKSQRSLPRPSVMLLSQISFGCSPV